MVIVSKPLLAGTSGRVGEGDPVGGKLVTPGQSIENAAFSIGGGLWQSSTAPTQGPPPSEVLISQSPSESTLNRQAIDALWQSSTAPTVGPPKSEVRIFEKQKEEFAGAGTAFAPELIKKAAQQGQETIADKWNIRLGILPGQGPILGTVSAPWVTKEYWNVRLGLFPGEGPLLGTLAIPGLRERKTVAAFQPAPSDVADFIVGYPQPKVAGFQQANVTPTQVEITARQGDVVWADSTVPMPGEEFVVPQVVGSLEQAGFKQTGEGTLSRPIIEYEMKQAGFKTEAEAVGFGEAEKAKLRAQLGGDITKLPTLLVTSPIEISKEIGKAAIGEAINPVFAMRANVPTYDFRVNWGTQEGGPLFSITQLPETEVSVRPAAVARDFGVFYIGGEILGTASLVNPALTKSATKSLGLISAVTAPMWFPQIVSEFEENPLETSLRLGAMAYGFKEGFATATTPKISRVTDTHPLVESGRTVLEWEYPSEKPLIGRNLGGRPSGTPLFEKAAATPFTEPKGALQGTTLGARPVANLVLGQEAPIAVNEAAFRYTFSRPLGSLYLETPVSPLLGDRLTYGTVALKRVPNAFALDTVGPAGVPSEPVLVEKFRVEDLIQNRVTVSKYRFGLKTETLEEVGRFKNIASLTREKPFIVQDIESGERFFKTGQIQVGATERTVTTNWKYGPADVIKIIPPEKINIALFETGKPYKMEGIGFYERGGEKGGILADIEKGFTAIRLPSQELSTAEVAGVERMPFSSARFREVELVIAPGGEVDVTDFLTRTRTFPFKGGEPIETGIVRVVLVNQVPVTGIEGPAPREIIVKGGANKISKAPSIGSILQKEEIKSIFADIESRIPNGKLENYPTQGAPGTGRMSPEGLAEFRARFGEKTQLGATMQTFVEETITATPVGRVGQIPGIKVPYQAPKPIQAAQTVFPVTTTFQTAKSVFSQVNAPAQTQRPSYVSRFATLQKPLSEQKGLWATSTRAITAQRQDIEQIIGVSKVVQSQVPIVMEIQRQRQDTVPIQIVTEKSILKEEQVFRTAPTTTAIGALWKLTPITGPPVIPGFGIPGLGGVPGLGRGGAGFRPRTYGYSPSFIARELGITAPKVSQTKFTGLEIRPVIRRKR